MGEWSLWAAAHHRPPGSDGQVQVLLTSCHIAVATGAAGEVRGGDVWGGVPGFFSLPKMYATLLPLACLPHRTGRGEMYAHVHKPVPCPSRHAGHFFFFYKAALRLKDLQSFTWQCRRVDTWAGGGVISSVTAAFVQQSAEVKQTQRRQTGRCASIDVFLSQRCFKNAPS